MKITTRTSRAATIACAFALLFAPGCKKDADTTPPDDAADSGGDLDDEDAPDESGGADEEPEEAEAEEVLTPGTFEETVNNNSGDVVDCYTEANAANPELKGDMQVLFTVGADGKVTEIKVEEGSTLNDEGLTKCVEEKVKGWQFPKPASGEPTSLPFPFSLEPG